MSTVITLHPDVLQKAEQALALTPLDSVEKLIAFSIEEKRSGEASAQEDAIYRVRGMLKGKQGGTALFMRDKQDEIEQEYRS
uniref:Uncharacterized protein n=1 Tax=Candidatus Kentrum eta TaxID=2126337 RepID=A0A450ULJ3_9GAMM|nr:MAG: hypothetical protein BECKH772A_GA0070896_1005615 [Candidatus Kentron sp. H]VFJ94128.1 MAG: hypothetical protein BECKH772B_GA0070898_1005516 [Candidatus Kentron sp. H]VFK06781.1 MAG: hypothetical protein BECKH772C_GA0070978_103733 [Candidatus Kentron sp. H]